MTAVSPPQARAQRAPALVALDDRALPEDPAARDVAAIRAHLDWLRLRHCTPASVQARQRALSRMRRTLRGNLLDATPRDLRRWLAGLQLAPSSIVTYVSHARGFYQWAVAMDLVEDNPAAALPLPRLPRWLPRPVAEKDLMDALEAAEPERIRPWLVLAGWAGLRCREIALLRREDVLDAADPPVIVVTTDAGKGGQPRVVPLSPFVLDELAWLLRHKRTGYLFGRRDGQPGPVPPHIVSSRSARHLRACGISATLHQLRHRFASRLWHQTHDLRLVQELMGHANPTTTAAYAAWDRIGATKAVGKLPTPRRQQPPRPSRARPGSP